MPAPKTFFNDGSFPRGTIRVIIPTGESCVAENHDIEEGAATEWVRDENNAPIGAIHTAEPITGKLLLQLPSGSTAIPNRFDTIFLLLRNVWNMFAILKVSHPRTQAGIRKFPLELAQ